MRPEISNELLLQVIQAWDPSKAKDWFVDDENELRWGENDWYIRWPDGQTYCYNEGSSYCEASKLVEFLLKDRPDLGLSGGRCPMEPTKKSLDSFDAFWASDPWGPHVPPKSVVNRIKSYEYLKGWKESQETFTAKNIADGFKRQREASTPSVDGASLFRAFGPKTITNFTGGRTEQELEVFATNPNITIVDGPYIRLCGRGYFKMKSGEALYLTNCGGVWCETSRKTIIDPSDVTVTIDGQTIEGIPGEFIEVPATYEKICPHCNGSKEVVGWAGKEPCNACH